MPDLPSCLYEIDGDRFVPTGLTRGPWDRGFQHGGPPAALLARAVEQTGAIQPALTARMSCDILRPVPLAPHTIATRILRPGRNVELVEATLSDAGSGDELMRMTAWRLRSEPVELPDGLGVPDSAPTLPPPNDLPLRPHFWTEPVAYHAALEWRFQAGDFDSPGPAIVWTRLRVELVDGEPPVPLERLLVMADAASGVSHVLDWERWLFINVDLGIHLERAPAGEWMAMDTVTRPGPMGVGLCVGVLSDSRGRVGLSTQTLRLAPQNVD